ncbi:hypothetical protein N7530_000790 [Penicillium desertorum]|uniref:Uncharacterized protein n=1 Tax=Penicillium desertorum TaxID=1303715 RepID=A0A9W9XA48_9EURO|nr:hypothetical protein N7530_000790 [Penicillium desertorum]
METWLAFGYENGFATRFQISFSQDSVELDDCQASRTVKGNQSKPPIPGQDEQQDPDSDSTDPVSEPPEIEPASLDPVPQTPTGARKRKHEESSSDRKNRKIQYLKTELEVRWRVEDLVWRSTQTITSSPDPIYAITSGYSIRRLGMMSCLRLPPRPTGSTFQPTLHRQKRSTGLRYLQRPRLQHNLPLLPHVARTRIPDYINIGTCERVRLHLIAQQSIDNIFADRQAWIERNAGIHHFNWMG